GSSILIDSVTDDSQGFAFPPPASQRRLVVLATCHVLAAALACSALGADPAAGALDVKALDGVPGFHRADLSRYLSLHMAEVLLADWRFAPATKGGSAPDRVEWSFTLNPYAGGDVRSFVGPRPPERV